MGNTIICGIDAHEKTLVTRIGVNQEAAETKRFSNTRSGRQALFSYVKKLSGEYAGGKMVMAYEASTLGYGIYDESVTSGIECHILAPTKMPAARKDRKKKTDERDAQRAFEIVRAYALAGNELPRIWIPDHQTRDDREVVRGRLDAAQKLTGLKCQVQTLLKRTGVVKPAEAGDSWTQRYRLWLKQLCIKPGAQIALQSLLRQIEGMEEEIKLLDQAVEQLAEGERYKAVAGALVRKVKGVGLLTAMVYVTELGDLSRFNNRKQVGSYLGLVPSSNESGEVADHKGHITREGSARVRKVLCQATWARVAHDKEEAVVYQRLVKKNPKHKKIAVVASMRRLGVLLWHIGLAAQKEAVAVKEQAA